MKIIGLTGGIGSGKSTIAKMFETLGVPVYFSDDEAKKIMTDSIKVKTKLIEEFGDMAFVKGKLNRQFLAKIIFNDKSKLLKINNLVHPEVNSHFKNWVDSQKSNFVIQENALIFENNKQLDFDEIITVTVPLNVRIERVMKRDHATKKEVLARINSQLSDDYKVKESNFVIHNLNLEKSRSQVYRIYKELTK